MSGSAEHTPTPWRSGGRVGYDLRILANQGPIQVCPAIAHGEADARFIVLACNAHDDLIAAIEEIRRRCDDPQGPGRSSLLNAIADLADRALAKARGDVDIVDPIDSDDPIERYPDGAEPEDGSA